MSRATAFIVPFAVLASASCGSPTAPKQSAALAITAVSPSQVTIGGGTAITVTGTGFGADAQVLIDGTPLTNVKIAADPPAGVSSLIGTTPAHSAGAAGVTVTSGGLSVAFAGSFTYVAPSGANAPPVISEIRTIGARKNQPSTFADLNDQIAVIATVTDRETSTSQLGYAWTASTGTITGTGATVTWTAPATLAVSPATVTLQLAVTETFTENGVTQRQTTTSTVAIYAHDTNKELLDMGEDFLRLFSLQVPKDQILHNFSTNCAGRKDEEVDIDHNQEFFTQRPTWSITRLPPIEINFGGTWPPYGLTADANSRLHVHWDAYHKLPSDPSYGTTDNTNGVDLVTGVLENNQWFLCQSSFVPDQGSSTDPAHQVMLDARHRIIRRY